MSYCFIDYLPEPDDGPGVTPDCPDGIGFILLAAPEGLGWGIFDIEEDHEWSPPNPVSAELAGLIESAKRYPPALALARDEVNQVFGDHLPSQAEFASAYGVALRTYLSRQHEAPYVLAPALKDELGYLVKGEWYWILRISGTPPAARWVSHDFHVYDNDINDFDLTGQQLNRLGYSV